MDASGSIDKSWIHLDCRDSRFMIGVNKFVDFALEHHRNKEVIPCPCRKCRNQGRAIKHDDVIIHCLKYGFDTTYSHWFVHGEKPVSDQSARRGSNFQENEHELDLNAAFNTVMEEAGANNLDEILEGPTGLEEVIEGVDINFSLPDAMSELYPGCSDFTVLRFVVKLFNLKITHGLTERCFTELLQLFKIVLPPGNKTPTTTYKANKLIKDLGLKYEKIDACRNDCILYWGEHKTRHNCPTCGVSRYKIPTLEERKKRVRPPAKVLRYFPLADRLRRLYNVDWVAKEMRWHSTGQSKPGTMGHPVDSVVWKTIDLKYPDFSAEPRNVRLGLATDGFNPFGTLGTSYSSWPVMCVIYNLPPWLCTKPQFTMLTALIEGPRQPGKDIDVYFQPLVKELQDLWREGVMVKDAFKHDVFQMHAVLLWTINDFPAYGNVSGSKTKGKYACPVCGPKTAFVRLKHGKKHVYMRHRRWCPLSDDVRKDTRESTFDKTHEQEEQPLRLTGLEVDEITKNLKMEWGKSKKTKQSNDNGDNEDDLCFYKRSIFFELDYWKHLPIRHTLDVMHIEKNVCEILIALMLNTKNKTKDDVNARKDLRRMKIKKRYWLTKVNGKTTIPPGLFWLRNDEKKMFFQTLRNLSVPVGFSSNWCNLVKADSLDLKGLKSHDYHILMQHLLPILIQHAYRDGKRKIVRSIIVSICTFFGALCSKRIDLETLNVLERGMVKTLCALERICPPSVFVIMMHLPIHLAHEARLCGPVSCRWMYFVERHMKIFKSYVSNNARPEGCIAERYLKEETLIYCAGYKGGGGILEKLDRKSENENQLLPDFFDNVNDDSTLNEFGPIGGSRAYKLEGVEYEQARHWVIKSHANYEKWYMKYTKFVEDTRKGARRRTGQNKVPLVEFIPWLKEQPEFLESSDDHFRDIVRGPTPFAVTYKKYCVNGFLFITKDYQETKLNQNSGVSTRCTTTFRSSAKDKNPVDDDVEYYGVLRKIIQLDYRKGYNPVLFKCDWVKCTQGVKIDEETNLRLVNLGNLISSERIGDEPFILAENTTQVFYSRDPKDPEWHVVLDVPKKVYLDNDEMCLVSDNRVVNDSEIGPSNIDLNMDDELVYNDADDAVVVHESNKKRKRARKH